MLCLFNISVTRHLPTAIVIGALFSNPIIRLPAQPTFPAPTKSDNSRSGKAESIDDPANVLSADEWRRVDAAVDRALSFLAAQQQPDGSFPTLDLGQPGVTGLCQLAFMAQGHLPETGPYGRHLERSTNYILRSQKQNGLVTLLGPDESPIPRSVSQFVGTAAVYNHAISSLTVSEPAAAPSRCVTRHALPSIGRARWLRSEMRHSPTPVGSRPRDERSR